MPWNNQPIDLYHGTLVSEAPSIMQGIDLLVGRPTVDFGRGFYTTTKLEQAQKWAVDRARLNLENTGVPISPCVLRFRISRNDLAGIDCLAFVRGERSAVDFWQLVLHCRKGRSNRVTGAWYDVVYGPVMKSKKRRSVHKNFDQISFHTHAGLALLNAAAIEEITIPWPV